jgi:hypothetical protein
MLDFSTGARRPVTDGARAKRPTAAQDLVQPTLAQHGLASSASPSSPPDTQGLMSLLQRVLPKGNGTTTPRPTPGSTPRPVDIPTERGSSPASIRARAENAPIALMSLPRP